MRPGNFFSRLVHVRILLQYFLVRKSVLQKKSRKPILASSRPWNTLNQWLARPTDGMMQTAHTLNDCLNTAWTWDAYQVDDLKDSNLHGLTGSCHGGLCQESWPAWTSAGAPQDSP